MLIYHVKMYRTIYTSGKSYSFYQDSNVINEFYVVAVYNNGCYSDPTKFFFTTDTAPPSAPKYVQQVSVTSGSLTLRWDHSTDNLRVAGYKVYSDSNLSNCVCTTTSNYITIRGLVNNSQYTLYVVACEALSGEGNRSTASQVTFRTPQ